MNRAKRVAVIGAGVAGLSCASALRSAGVEVVVFEKSRGIGGRMATRRRDGNQFDHGAQAIDAAADGMHDWIAAAIQSGQALDWPAARDGGARMACIGTPGMSDLCRPLAQDLDIRFEADITGLERENGGWAVIAAESTGGFSHIVLAIPAPQVARLAAPLDDMFLKALAAISFAPCYALMVAFGARPAWPDIVPAPPEPFEWIARDSSKPGRPGDAECWVAHATESWSKTHLELERPEAADLLLDALAAGMGPLPQVRAAMGHRWRFSRVSRPLGAPFLATADGEILAGGDWALGRSVQHARRSGLAIAHALQERIAVAD